MELWRASFVCDEIEVFDAPTEMYSLMSGKRKRRISAKGAVSLLRGILQSPSVSQARERNLLTVILERPSPIPDLDGWQSTAVSGNLQ